MPDKSLRKLESYQSGGNIGSGSNGCNSNNNNDLDDNDDNNDENGENNKHNHHTNNNNIDITIAINDNNVNHYVNRAKTKRDNGSGTTTSTIGVKSNNITNPSSSSSSVHPPLLSQFSLIGQADDSDDYDEGGSTITEDRNSWWQGCMRRIYHHHHRTSHHRRSVVSLLAIGISCLTLFVILNNGADNNNNGGVTGTDSSSIEHDDEIPTLPISNDQQHTQTETASCPMQSSYSVPFDIMELKNSSTVENANHGAVATDHPLCSQIGLSILRDDGGNAADATVASALCLGVVNPTSSGIGGGAFILVHNNDDDGSKRDDDDENYDDDFDDTGPIFEDARASSSSGSTDATTTTASKRRRKVDRTEFIDCRETAPRNATYDMFESNPESSMLGGLAIAIPGELRGLELLHHRHGSLPWSALVRPSMELARNGFIIETYLADAIRSKAKHFRNMPHLGRTFTKNNDGKTLLEVGDLLVRRRYAETLEAIMDGGADAVYGGELAKRLAKDIQDAGGIITSEDILNYRPVLRDPLISRVAGYTIAGAPPPSSGGGVIIGALRFLSGFATPFSATANALSKHWYIEACRHVFAIRMSLSDPKFAPEENRNAVNDLIEGEYMETLRRMTLDDDVLDLSQYGGRRWAQLKNTDGGGALVDAQEGDRRRRRVERTHNDASGSHNNRVSRDMRLFNYLEDHGTTSLSVVDKHRNTVTMTSSVNLNFGSKVVSPSTGIILNNQMDDFSSPGLVNYFGVSPSESNYVAPGKRPLSSMSPTMVFRDTNHHHGPTETADPNGKISGKLVLSLGASGGPKIITSVLQTILNHAIVGIPLYESISAPRVHNQLLYHGAAGTNVEEDTLPQGPDIRLSERTRFALERRGHKLIAADFLGTVQAVAVDSETGTLTAVSDIRKQGTPAGY